MPAADLLPVCDLSTSRLWFHSGWDSQLKGKAGRVLLVLSQQFGVLLPTLLLLPGQTNPWPASCVHVMVSYKTSLSVVVVAAALFWRPTMCQCYVSYSALQPCHQVDIIKQAQNSIPSTCSCSHPSPSLHPVSSEHHTASHLVFLFLPIPTHYQLFFITAGLDNS